MDHLLRPRTPEPSFDDLLRNFAANQAGEGVVTRRQARLEAQQPVINNLPSAEAGPQSVEIEQQQEPEAQQGQEAPVETPVEEKLDSAEAPYLRDTLVASNGEVEAYCVKSHFRRMINFA